MGTLTEISLFTGAGGGVLGSILLGHRIVCYVEWDKYCQKVIQARIADGIYDNAPIWDDVRTFDGKPWRGKVDIVSAGFPCQPFSVAGKRKGIDDERNMWPDTIRIIGEVRPRFAFLENVPGLLVSGYMGRIFGDISELGYDCRWGVIGADDVGAPHRRKRLWIFLADSHMSGNGTSRSGVDLDRQAQDEGRAGQPQPEPCGYGQDVAIPEVPRLEGAESAGDTRTGGLPAKRRCTWWDIDPADVPDAERRGQQPASPELLPDGGGAESFTATCDDRQGIRPTQPRLGRVANGVAHRVDRLKAIGNGQVPRVVQEAWETLTGEMT